MHRATGCGLVVHVVYINQDMQQLSEIRIFVANNMSPIAAFLQYLEHSSQLQYSFSPIFLLFMLLLLGTLIISLKSSPTNKSINLPPSIPNKLPIIGHLHQLGPLPHHQLQTFAQKHGPLMMIHLGSSPTLVVSSPQAAKEIMKTHDLIFSSRPSLTIAKRFFYDKDLAFVPYGEYWRRVRRTCIYQLLSAKRVQSFRSVREEETKLMIQKIATSCNSSDQVVNLSDMIMTLTNDTVCTVAFGRKYSGEEVGGKRLDRILEEIIYLLGVFNFKDYVPWLGWLNHFTGLHARVEKTFREMDCFLERIVQDHIERKKKNITEGKDGGGKDDGHHEYIEDLVDVLLGIEKDDSLGLFSDGDLLGRDSIKGIIMDMFGAGTDTSHSVLVWAMAELMRHPNTMKQVQQEVRETVNGRLFITEDDISKMHYLQSIIKETLRLHPPLPVLVPRESTEDAKIQGYDIPAKSRVLINFYAIGRDPGSWEEPNKFEPGRFINSSVDFKGCDFEFIPFGAGRRGCPGIAFATASIELALANLLFRFDWKLPGDANGKGEGNIDMTETSGMVVHKKSPLLLVATDHYCNN